MKRAALRYEMGSTGMPWQGCCIIWDQEVGGSNSLTPITEGQRVPPLVGTDETRVAGWVAAMRIVAVVGMALALATGTFLIVGGVWLPGALVLLAFIPFFLLMWLLERSPGVRTRPR